MTLDDVAAIAAGLPEVTEGEGHDKRSWSVAGKTFAWQRPFSKADLRRFGTEAPPSGPILAVRLQDVEETRAVLAEGRVGVFTIPHFDGYAAVLVQLDAVAEPTLRELVLDGSLACAPARLTEAYLDRD